MFNFFLTSNFVAQNFLPESPINKINSCFWEERNQLLKETWRKQGGDDKIYDWKTLQSEIIRSPERELFSVYKFWWLLFPTRNLLLLAVVLPSLFYLNSVQSVLGKYAAKQKLELIPTWGSLRSFQSFTWSAARLLFSTRTQPIRKLLVFLHRYSYNSCSFLSTMFLMVSILICYLNSKIIFVCNKCKTESII